MGKVRVASTLLFLLVTAGASARAQEMCLDHEKYLQSLYDCARRGEIAYHYESSLAAYCEHRAPRTAEFGTNAVWAKCGCNVASAADSNACRYGIQQSTSNNKLMSYCEETRDTTLVVQKFVCPKAGK